MNMIYRPMKCFIRGGSWRVGGEEPSWVFPGRMQKIFIAGSYETLTVRVARHAWGQP
jgi:hypothetical protein